MLGMSSLSPKESAQSAMLQEIRNASAWDGMKQEELSVKGEPLLLVLKKCVNLSPDDARNLISRLMQCQREDQFQEWRKVHVFNRLYFNVPEWESKKDFRAFGGWHGIPVQQDMINMLFPLQVKGNGEVVMTGVFCGGYTGPDYRGLAEFDYFLKKYGRRFSGSKAK
jgi:hypothetical protein